ncbi:MAG TPA: hypothetical protein VGB05_07530, partial [Pyrinomonadaceae bacterium]
PMAAVRKGVMELCAISSRQSAINYQQSAAGYCGRQSRFISRSCRRLHRRRIAFRALYIRRDFVNTHDVKQKFRLTADG